MKNSIFENFDCGEVILTDPCPIFRKWERTIGPCLFPFLIWKRMLK